MAREASGKKYVDLHIHSTYSDGTCPVREIVELAFEKNLRTISITDHDCIDSYPFARELGNGVGLEVIPGVELSSEIGGVDIHILGYFVDIQNRALNDKLREMKEARYHRAKKIVANLNGQGIDLRFETVLRIAGEGAIGRPHIAAAMLREELIYSFREAFEKYIGYDSPSYVEKKTITPHEVFQLILDAGGLPVLAHPGVTGVDERIPGFIREGLAGIEVYHSEHSAAIRKHYLRYCQKHDLAMTGGSDFHSATQIKGVLGTPRIAYAVVESLKQKYQAVHGRELVI
ncbi:MAG: PHP domain-containing protein [Chitinivibrionales bacterium]|nr:PHP domain-containing protein [Chitinivibrionales bacterium]MBD3394455.1 PHP domain-containing protein [Chitinivibrionales bacterium]